MAVLEHEVHERVKHGPDARYGCNNRPPFKSSYWIPARRFFPDGSFETVSVRTVFRMSEECRYDLSLTDSKCQGCKHRGTGEAYDKMIREKGME